MTWNTEAQQALLSRDGTIHRWLLWIDAKNAVTGDPSPLGLWDGEEDFMLNVDGVDRTYQETLLEPDVITYGKGTEIRYQSVTVAGVGPETAGLLTTLDARLSECELRLAIFDPETSDLIDSQPMWVGELGAAPFSTPALGQGGSTIELSISNRLRRGTMAVPTRKTDTSHRLRAAFDAFRKFGHISAKVTRWWGSRKVSAAGSTFKGVLRDGPFGFGNDDK